MPSFPRPSTMPPQMHTNVCGDSACPEPILQALIDAFASAANPVDALNVYETWRRTVDLSSLPPAASPTVNLGRLHFERAFVDLLTAEIEVIHGVGLITRNDVEETLRFVMGKPSALSPSEADTFYRTYIEPRQINLQPVWVFLIDTSIDVTRDLAAPSCLPWRLGLNRVTSGSTYVGMQFAPSRIHDARPPCTADVDFSYHDFWRPGGQTRPHPSTPAACPNIGCSELIARPPTLADVQAALRQVVAQ